MTKAPRLHFHERAAPTCPLPRTRIRPIGIHCRDFEPK
ncbi:hypothetical protein SNOG_07792 [Parastagonospora nodorum SN15]|uniref:Uncharacterized protein n=1 Tax=Phaeosphaeria nodorum (strain SN15 / ATCC MYA-4574 / FGSC 10173) TaxID=321614 RepID=Q0UKC2_PHANO|nr:hypothetical protein SNOG_07792 [Parastagonospora nodorum SN15]EAT85258.1 hypothetical protein SNOG_07792 [Parastagonospora nodorum SN15]